MSLADVALWSIALGSTVLGGPREEGDKQSPAELDTFL